jgi:hypothetical protein
MRIAAATIFSPRAHTMLAVVRVVGLAATLNEVRDLAAIMMAGLDVVAHRPRGGTAEAVARFASEMSERSGAEVVAGVLLTISEVAGDPRGPSVSILMGMTEAVGLHSHTRP